MDFKELATSVHDSKGFNPVVDCDVLLSLDPGHTTGWAVFDFNQQPEWWLSQGQIETDDIHMATAEIGKLILDYEPDIVVMEDYRIYKWRAEHHAGSDVLTTRVIGCIETLCIVHQIEHVYKQPAQVAKQFCTDKKLKDWGFYTTGMRHARDAIRHACYFTLFGPLQHKDKKGVTVG